MLTPILNRFIYHPEATAAPPSWTPAHLGVAYEDVTLRTRDGVNIIGWYFPAAEARSVVLYLHGNAGNLRDWAAVAPHFVRAQYAVFILDYRGYGQSAGQPSEPGLYHDGTAAWEWLQTRAAGLPIYVLGKSLGSGVATYLAAHHTPAGLILDSAYTSIREVIAHNAPWLPRFVLPKLFESISRAPRITCPTLLIHGEADTLIPAQHSVRLYAVLSAPKALCLVPNAGHNDVITAPAYARWVADFLHDPVSFIQAQQAESEAAKQVYLGQSK